MLTQAPADPRAWTAATIDDPSSWYYPLPDACLAAFEQVQGELRSSPRPITSIQLPDSQRSTLTSSLRPVLDVLENGRGFAIVEAPRGQRVSPEDATLLYWIVGLGLGEPFEQNVQGTLLYDVRDTGQDLSKGARFSVTSYESSFHTDNSFGTDILDYVGLLCLNVAKSGGRSQMLSALAVYNALKAERPEVLETLSRPFHIDRRGGIREGEAPTIEYPVFQWDGQELLIRYLRYWIEEGHKKVGEPLSSAQVAALNTLDEFLKRRDLQIEFDLKPGDMYFINNRWTLHNRTAFEDYPEMERRRHLVRLWLKAR